MSQFANELIRKLSNAALVERIKAFTETTDDQMLTALVREALRRGL